MDIHRARFVPYPPSAINCLSFSHKPDRNDATPHPAARLAVGRANGDIELWNPSNGDWIQESIIRGGKDRSIEGLAWTEEPDEETWARAGHPELNTRNRIKPKKIFKGRLFSVGYSSAVTEWDLDTGLPLKHCAVHHSEAWCIVAQPTMYSPSAHQLRQFKREKTGNPPSAREAINEANTDDDNVFIYEPQHLAVGHSDGSITLLSTADNDLSFVRIVGRPTKRKARVLCMAFQNRNTLVAGYSDSAIRVYDINTSTLIRTIHLGASSTGSKDLLVWAVACLPNGNIVSGDSSGEVRIWNGQKFFQTQVLVGHQADVLGLAASQDGRTIFSTGMDRRVTVFETESLPGGGFKFFEASHSRYHQHDVKAIATFESKSISVVATGGLDTNLVVAPLRNRRKELHFSLAGLPQVPALDSAPKKRMICSWWNQEVSIWLMSSQDDLQKGTDFPYQLLSKFHLSGEENISDVSISDDGDLLAVATTASVRLFALKLVLSQNLLEESATDSAITIKKLQTPTDLTDMGANYVRFSPNGKWLCAVRLDNSTCLTRFVFDGDSRVPKGEVIQIPRLSRELSLDDREAQEKSSMGPYLRRVNRIAFSPDSKTLVATDLEGWIDSWFLEGEENMIATAAVIEQSKLRKSPNVIPDNDSDAGSDDDDDDEAVFNCDPSWKSRHEIYGQRWIQNPKSKSMMKLDSPALLLSFRPQPKATPLSEQSLDLMIVTAKHHFFEFHLSTGLLSEWTKRNPYYNLPQQFRGVRNRAIGCLWQLDGTKIGSSKQNRNNKLATTPNRFWIWGHTWLFMFNLSEDFPINPDAVIPTKKRRRGHRELLAGASNMNGNTVDDAPAKDISVDTSGVLQAIESFSKEDQIVNQARDTGAGGTIHRGEHIGINTDNIRVIIGSDAMEDVESTTTTPTSGVTPSDKLSDFQKQQLLQKNQPRNGNSKTNTPQLWRTLKYRPILGIVPIQRSSVTVTPRRGMRSLLPTPPDGEEDALKNIDGNDSSISDDGMCSPLEVVLVERPDWDLDMPDRLVGLHDRH